jgi:hypothetical protein
LKLNQKRFDVTAGGALQGLVLAVALDIIS